MRRLTQHEIESLRRFVDVRAALSAEHQRNRTIDDSYMEAAFACPAGYRVWLSVKHALHGPPAKRRERAA